MSKNRGFSALKGVTISRVDASAVNQVVLLDHEGKNTFTINVELSELGVPVLTLTKRRHNKKAAALPEKKQAPKSKHHHQPWPFPPVPHGMIEYD